MLKKFFLIKAISLFLYSCNHVPEEKSLKTDLIEKATDEVKLFINDQYDFFSIGSIDEAERKFYKDAVLIGTDEKEYFFGWNKIKPSLLGQIDAIENPKFVTRSLNITMSDDGKMASYNQIIDFSYRTPTTESSSGVKYEIKNIRNSGVIKKISGDWKLIQIHWSIGVKGKVIEYELKND